MIMRKTAGLTIALLLATSLVSSASAAVIQIQLGGVGLEYDGSKIVDTGPKDPDELTNAAFLLGDTTLGVIVSDVTMNLEIPGVSSIPKDGGQVTSDAGGYLDLTFALGDGPFINLTLDKAVVNYMPVIDTFQFIFAGSSSSIDDQLLPFGLELVDPVSVSFSTQIRQIANDGTYVTSFTSAGTGEIQGVPEPATVGMLALGGIAALWRKRRKVA